MTYCQGKVKTYLHNIYIVLLLYTGGVNMVSNSTRSRINFYATDKITGIIKKYTEELGMNQGAFISMCIAEYAKNDDMLQNMSTIQTTLSELVALKDSVEKQK